MVRVRAARSPRTTAQGCRVDVAPDVVPLENQLMYDLPLEELDKERKLRIWVLDNNCLYMKHVLAENPDIDLWMFTPTWHALNHGYVRPAAVTLRARISLIRCAPLTALPSEKLCVVQAVCRTARRRDLRTRMV